MTRMLGLSTLTLVVTLVTELAALSTPCPPKCKCGWSKIVVCEQLKSLTDLSTGIPSDSNEIHIENSQIRILTQNDFSSIQTTQILELRITNSRLSEIQDNAFQSLGTLRKLILSENQIFSVSKDAFEGIVNLQELDLSHNKIQSFANLEVLNPLTSLKILDLGYNLFHSFPSGLFIAQRNLQTLTLEGNHLGTLEGNSLQGLHNLRVLYASNCDIRNIESSVFKQLGSVDTLDLSDNDLYIFPSHTDLETLRVLRNLTLQGNKLTGLSNDQFQGLHLDTLDLSRNSITKIEPHVFRNVGSIRNLYLSFNNLNSLPDAVFKPMAEQVINLQLNNNKGLTHLPPNLFSGMTTLTDLNLSSCSLQSLDEKQFQDLHNLHTIDIASNFLKFLPQMFFDKAVLLMHVKLEKNPWHCDCLIKPLRNFLQSPRAATAVYCSGAYAGFSTDCDSVTCASPTNLVGKNVKNIQDDELATCAKLINDSGPPVTIIIVVVAVIFVLGIIGLVVVCLFYRRHKHGEPLLCTESESHHKKKRKRSKRENRGEDFYVDKKDRGSLDPDIGSLNESDKSYVVRNYFSSMLPDQDAVSRGTPSMTRKESFDSISRYTGVTGRGSEHSSQYSLNEGYRIESAV